MIHILTIIFLIGSALCHSSQFDLSNQINFVNDSILKQMLLEPSLKMKDILKYHKMTDSSINLVSPLNVTVLGLFESKGVEELNKAKIYANRLTHISPNWFKLRLNEDEETTHITGLNNIDSKWLKTIRSLNPKIKIVPRVVLDNWFHSQLIILLTVNRLPGFIGKQLVELAKKSQFDGYVLEMWTAFASQQKADAALVISKISNHFKRNNLILIIVVPPPIHYGDRLGLFLREDVERLAPHVQGFLIMTYDYSNFQRPGPNSPLNWIKKCITLLVPKEKSLIRQKLLIALNFYGHNYTPTGGHLIDGKEYLSILRKNKPKLIWDDVSHEHYFEYKSVHGKNWVFYPSIHSIYKRIQLFKKLKTGAALCNLNQGLDYFSLLF